MNGDDFNWDLADNESVWIRSCTQSQSKNEVPLVALIRVRNEELILQDTLNHLSDFADIICAYDDASTDKTLEILKSHPKVGLVIENNSWLSGIENRLLSETRHRGLLLQESRKYFSFNWCMCCDADERYFGSIREFVTETFQDKPDAVRFQLFDAYMTEADSQPYLGEHPLIDFRQFFGPECRNILILWRNSRAVRFIGLDAREPFIDGNIVTKFRCQHYGKSLSYEHWQATCEYYVANFPWETYGKKWDARRGNALHKLSDFGRPLFRWGDQLFENAVTDF